MGGGLELAGGGDREKTHHDTSLTHILAFPAPELGVLILSPEPDSAEDDGVDTSGDDQPPPVGAQPMRRL